MLNGTTLDITATGTEDEPEYTTDIVCSTCEAPVISTAPPANVNPLVKPLILQVFANASYVPVLIMREIVLVVEEDDAGLQFVI